MTAQSDHRVLAISSDTEQERRLARYAEPCARAHDGVVVCERVPAKPDAFSSALDAIAARLAEHPVDRVVIGWYRDAEKMRALARLRERVNVTLLVVKDWTSEPVKRVLASTGGGAHFMETARLMNDLSVAWKKPSQILRVVRAPRSMSGNPALLRRYLKQIRQLTKMQTRVLGVDAPITLRASTNVVEEIVSRTRRGDLIIMGGPKEWRIEKSLIGSIPADIAFESDRPVVMVISRHKDEIDLSQVFWEQTVRMNLKAHDKWEAITALADALVEEKQMPAALRDTVIERATAREKVMPTATGCETAIPHAAISGFKGLVGCLGVCPGGIDFGDANGELTRFVFLLVTPKEQYGEYLAVLSGLAHVMHDDLRRNRILQARTPTDVVAELTGLINGE